MKSKPVVLITGASSGIGKALCEEFAKDGYDLILAARSIDKMQAHAADLQHRFGIQVAVIGADLESPEGGGARTKNCPRVVHGDLGHA
jgi:hypothetical protein